MRLLLPALNRCQMNTKKRTLCILFVIERVKVKVKDNSIY